VINDLSRFVHYRKVTQALLRARANLVTLRRRSGVALRATNVRRVFGQTLHDPSPFIAHFEALLGRPLTARKRGRHETGASWDYRHDATEMA